MRMYPLPDDVTGQFAPNEIVDTSGYVDDCACLCRSHVHVKDGLIHVHETPVFDKLLIKGDLNLSGDVDLQRLPNFLAVTGSVMLSDCVNLKVMPSRMHVGENLWMERTNVRELPETLVVGQSLHVEDCESLIELPAGISAIGVYASNCASLKQIGSGLDLFALDLSGGPIAALPLN